MSKSEFYVVRRGSTSLTNKVILSGLSYEALGLLLTELSLRLGTPLGYRNMVKPGCGESRVRKAHKELEAAGFRHRLLVRASDGSLKTVTIVTDESMPTYEVLGEIDLPEGDYVVKIQTDHEPVVPKFERPRVEGSGRQTRRSHRAVKNTARSDQGKRDDPEKTEETEKPSSHRAVVTTARLTAARSTVPRLSTAGRSPNTLRVKDYPPSPQPPMADSADSAGELSPMAGDGAAAPRGVSPVGSTGMSDSSQRVSSLAAALPDDDSGESSAEVLAVASAEDWRLVTSAIPAVMRQGLDEQDVPRVASLLRLRLEAGWSVTALHAALAAWQVPEVVHDWSALVVSRLERLTPLEPEVPNGAEEPQPAVGDSEGLEDSGDVIFHQWKLIGRQTGF